MKSTLRKLLVLAMGFVGISAFADTAIETETAQIGKQGEFGFSQSIEFERATDAQRLGTLTQFEYGITDRSEILIEPFFQEWIFPKGEDSVHGPGDLEITPSYMVVKEEGATPAILIATKFKIPTASREVEGSGKVDYYPYFIFGQHLGMWTFNANIGVNFANPGNGEAFEKKLIWDLEAEREVMPKLTLFLELYSAEDGIFSGSTAAEYQFAEHANAFIALAYNQEHSLFIRPGFNLQF
ncbi:MAG: transporter [Bdellovibrionota bacterium]